MGEKLARRVEGDRVALLVEDLWARDGWRDEWRDEWRNCGAKNVAAKCGGKMWRQWRVTDGETNGETVARKCGGKIWREKCGGKMWRQNVASK